MDHESGPIDSESIESDKRLFARVREKLSSVEREPTVTIETDDGLRLLELAEAEVERHIRVESGLEGVMENMAGDLEELRGFNRRVLPKLLPLAQDQLEKLRKYGGSNEQIEESESDIEEITEFFNSLTQDP